MVFFLLQLVMMRVLVLTSVWMNPGINEHVCVIPCVTLVIRRICASFVLANAILKQDMIQCGISLSSSLKSNEKLLSLCISVIVIIVRVVFLRRQESDHAGPLTRAGAGGGSGAAAAAASSSTSTSLSSSSVCSSASSSSSSSGFSSVISYFYYRFS